MSKPETTMHADDFAFHVKLVSRRVNEHLGGDATIDDLVRIMLDMGWSPPSEARCIEAERLQEEAYAAFDRWLAEQSDEVQDLSLLEQIEVYANVGR